MIRNVSTERSNDHTKSDALQKRARLKDRVIAMKAVRPDYDFDLFISYRRQEFCRQWVRDEFVPQFRSRLEAELGGTPEIFYDETSVNDGEIIREKVLQALAKSACILTILSRAYFTSNWCLAEWKTFETRAEMEGLHKKGKSLIVPVQWQDGKHYAEHVGASAMQGRDFREFRLVGIGWHESRGYVDYQKSLNKLAKLVATLIENAPAFKDEWPVLGPEDVEPISPTGPLFPANL